MTASIQVRESWSGNWVSKTRLSEMSNAIFLGEGIGFRRTYHVSSVGQFKERVVFRLGRKHARVKNKSEVVIFKVFGVRPWRLEITSDISFSHAFKQWLEALDTHASIIDIQ